MTDLVTAELVAAWRGRRVLVLGDAMVDGWLRGTADRVCREAPLPVVDLADTGYACGGAANTAANLAALGAQVRLVAAVGDDADGELLHRLADAAGVVARLVRVPGRRTLTKRRLLAEGQIVARFDEGDTGPVPAAAARQLLAAVAEELSWGTDAVLVCDYGCGGLPDRLAELVAAHRPETGLLAVDAHDLARWAVTRPDLVTPSFAEAVRLLDPGAVAPPRDGARAGWIEPWLGSVREAVGAGTVAVTMDVDGALVVDASGAPTRTTAARPVPAAWSTGAGDSYLAAFTLALLAGAPTATAARLAQSAADSVLDSAGTAVCSIHYGASTVDDLVHRVQHARAAGARIVFTNGCFDVLHRGHVGYLSEARALGDRLVVAVNSDESVRRLKGPGRPVNPVEDRVAVLAALSCVDDVVVFEQDSPEALLTMLRPDVYVKGGDYRPELIPEAELVTGLGGEVRTLSYLPDRSTSAIIDRIRGRAQPERARA
jgi:D-beta-D-heptose 7-phosphate kinase / D-beta-D-heptose 1-phosphate adenosyltransferase